MFKDILETPPNSLSNQPLAAVRGTGDHWRRTSESSAHVQDEQNDVHCRKTQSEAALLKNSPMIRLLTARRRILCKSESIVVCSAISCSFCLSLCCRRFKGILITGKYLKILWWGFMQCCRPWWKKWRFSAVPLAHLTLQKSAHKAPLSFKQI